MGEKRAIVVLGMHRSGTSSVTGALSLLGAASPRTLMPAAEDNPKGFWESQPLMLLHDRLLAAGGSSWRDWRPFNLSAALEAEPTLMGQARACLVDEFQEASLIVLKDPRICRFLPFWSRLLEDAGYHTMVVCPLRPPVDVANSLAFRNDMGLEEGGRLWLRHVLDAERSSRDLPRYFVNWQVFLSGWRDQVRQIDAKLGLGLELDNLDQPSPVDEFLSPELVRQTTSGIDLHPWTTHAWDCLCGLVNFSDDSAIQDRLDELRWKFDEACSLFP